MENKRETWGTMTLPSVTAICIWRCELLGQMSDGLWENTRPHQHWRFWHQLDVAFGAVPGVVHHTGIVVKASYGFNKLFEYVGERMLAYGRACRAGWDIHDHNDLQLAAEHMPGTFEEFKVTQAQRSAYNGQQLPVTDEQAQAFYAAKPYTKRDLNADLKLIKAAMKNVSWQSKG